MKFSGKTPTTNRAVRPTTPVRTTGPAVTHEGGKGYSRDAKSELFLLAATNMVENTYYEGVDERGERFSTLVHKVASEDPAWLEKFIPWLRDTANMRSASVVAAAEYVASKASGGRQVVAQTLLRADEPGEILGYWLTKHGRNLPQPLKRGVADAINRLYTERNLLKYDGQSKGIRFGDVVELTHPKAKSPQQSALYRHAIDRRHNHDETIPEELEMLRDDRFLLSVNENERRGLLRRSPDALANAGWTWERLSGWLPGGMDAEAWESVIPQMGYMALLRNLRNFDEAKISKTSADYIRQKLENSDEVAKSRQFPFRFLSAYKAAPSMNWGPTLEAALDLSVQNIPELGGKTLILVDVSGSMMCPLSRRSSVQNWEAGALFGLATWKRSSDVDLVAFGTNSKDIKLSSSTSVLRGMDNFSEIVKNGLVGWGTNAYPALAKHYAGHDRVVFFTDCQIHPYGGDDQAVADKVPVIHTFNLAGYRAAAFEAGKPGRHEYGGFSDATFRLMAAVEKFESAGWNALFKEKI